MGIRRRMFRGYNLKNKKWLYGYYLFNRGKHFIAEEGLQPPGMTWEDFEVDPESVGQYICDIDGVECFEGDIINKKIAKGKYGIGFSFVIRYNIRTTSYGFKNDFNEWIGVWPNEPIFEYKVIGNEYEEKLKISNP
jgi:hypothetical protein